MTPENLLPTLYTLVIFTVFGTVFWLIPGNMFLPRNQRVPFLDRFFLSLTFGLTTYTLVVFVTRLAGLPFWAALLLMLALGFLRGITRMREILVPRGRITPAQKLFVAIAISGMLIQGLVLFRSAIRTPEGLQFTELSFHDSIWHIYLIDELKVNFPPRHAGFAPAVVKNYHFLLDLVIASVATYLPLSTFELYYRVIPIFVSLLSSLGIYVLSRRLSRSEWVSNVALFLVLFAGNASWFVQFFRGPEFQYSANTFMLDPYLDLLQNPHAVIIFPLMIAGIMGLMRIEEKGKDLPLFLLSSIAFGVMIGFKAWGGILMLLTLPLAASWLSLFKRRHEFWMLWFVVLVVSIVIFLPLYEPQTAAGLVFIPGWLLKRMVEDPDRYNMPKYYFLEQYYRQIADILGLLRINLIEVLLYLFGNLWIRVLGFLGVASLFLQKRSALSVFILSVIVASLALPLLFNQGRMSYDIIQFGPYSLFLLAIFTALTLARTSVSLPRRLRIFVFLAAMILAVPSNSKSIIARARDKSFLVGNAELEVYSYLREKTGSQSILLVYPSPRNISTAFVAAMSQRPTYYSAETFNRITGEDFERRREKLLEIFNSTDPVQRRRLIEETPINYILLTKDEDRLVDLKGLSLTEAFSNDQMIVYKID